MIARGELELETDIQSDTAPLGARMRGNIYGRDACIIGEVKAEPQGIVAMRTSAARASLICSSASNCQESVK
jgi:hydrogenase maturation factor